MIYCTLLNPALDVMYDIAELKPGVTMTDVPSQIFPAGKGINVASVVKTLGEDVTVVGIVPEYSNKQFTEYLNRLGVSSRFFSVKGSARINATILENANGGTTHISSAGAQLTTRVQDEALHFIRSYMSEGDLWAFSGSLPRGFESDSYRKLVRFCREKGCATMLDSRGDALRVGMRAKPAMVKPNLAELEQFFGEQIQGVHHIALKGKRLADMGVEYVFISLGSDGMIAIHDNDCLLCSAPAVKVIDQVGAGDALVGGLLVGHSRKFSFPEMCRMAVACGVSKAMHRGPGNITRDEVWQFMEEVKVRAI
ncbi:MAG TPA: 1-phosphofructokinase family hexose kinase [Chitinivibrionales bacterium]|nr:1-phosphofructokinase family hexose kinase [Chitinivibrionales bacterium]